MLAARPLLGLGPIAGLYQPISRGQVARGVVCEDSELADAAVATDRRDAAELDALLDAVAGRAREVAEAIAAGELQPRPETCGWNRRCLYPGVCRCEP